MKRQVAMLAATMCGVFASVGLIYGQSPYQVPPVPTPRAVVEVIGISISPEAPPVGEYYTVSTTVRLNYHRPVTVRVTVYPPEGDSPPTVSQELTIEPNSTRTFQLQCYCGRPGGVVNVRADPVRIHQ